MNETNRIAFFHTFGFLHLRSFFNVAEVIAYRETAQTVLEEDAAEHPFDGTERQQLQGFAERSPTLRGLIDDPRILDLAQQLLGKALTWVGSDGNRYVGDTGWHPDGSSFDLRRVKFALYLDPLTAETGALRLVPGSHRCTLHDDLRTLLQRDDTTITPYGVRASRRTDTRRSGFGLPANEVPCTVLETQPGDLVIFDQNVWHASFSGRTGRMMFTLNYAITPQTDQAIAYALSMYEGQLEHVRQRQWQRRDHVFDAALLHSDKPELRALFAFWREHGFT
ncbi:MAG TPA: phytanoyl-CoA dioxygenase family protein [Tepidisphaeraceae bacterium]|jgi:hypothetical protein